MHDLAAALSEAVSREDVATAVVDTTVPVFGAAGAVVAMVGESGNTIELIRAAAMPAEIENEWRSFPLASDVPIAEVARTGEAVFIESREEWIRRYPAIGELLAATGHHAVATLPLVAGGRKIGALGLSFDAPRKLSSDERALALSAARLCAQALERARLFDDEKRARAVAEGANRAKTEFLTVMSHELRTPLNAIAGYAELLEVGVYGELNSAQLEGVSRLQRSQRHLLSLINEVLTYAHIESGVAHYDMADVRVEQALVLAEALVAPQARAKGLSISVYCEHPGATVRADAEKLQQILLNLLSNAVKFTDAGGIELRCDVSEASGNFVVCDTGRGIPHEELDRIFEPFVQIDPTLTRTSHGVGLGLAISRDLARKMGGDLVASSGAQKGSTFTLTLPRPAPAKQGGA
ncbi:MAG TPA: GAF domain-containing sensor histidine kinase [Gemmatimonadaceae bacterium]|nr:GAF domain-containing sensor histidine kinase [Gemmatimonadaceae bacterium]